MRKKISKLKQQRYPRWPPKAIILDLGHFSTKTAENLGYDSVIDFKNMGF
jgi:hypothetical protein